MEQAMDGFMIGIVGAVIGLILLIRLMMKTKFWDQLTAPDIQKKEDGYSNTQGWESLKGSTGISDTDFTIRLGEDREERIFVISEGGFIDEGKEVNTLCRWE
ncbi:hypothetical protein Ct9H90mP29_21090 [bacterium]|nr:MAG: hypothetical protein Ct9H90mP29_21090 [bacterium]